MILLGYLSVLAYVSALIVISDVVLRRFVSKELCRKVLHIGTCFAYPIARLFFKDSFLHFAILCALFVIVTVIMYKMHLMKTVDGRERSYPGIVYYALSLLLLSLFCLIDGQSGDIFFIAMLALSFGDGFATLVGTYFPTVTIYRHKTLGGFLACTTFTFVSGALYQVLTEWILDWYELLLIALLAAVVELVDFGLDNMAIPLSVFFASLGCLYLEGFTASLGIGLAVFTVAFFSRLIAYYGALLAAFLGALFFFAYGGWGIGFVLFCYAVMVSVSLVSKLLKNDISDVVKKTKGKDIVEIVANGFWGIVSAALFLITKNETFFAISLMVVSAGFVDSLASDIGTLSKKTPFDPFRRKRVSRGVSGGMTLLGSMASLIGAFVFAIAIVWIVEWDIILLVPIALVLYAGSLIDTLLGSLVQVKYQCPICQKTTEKEMHCSVRTIKVGGVSYINNDTVNILSNTAVFVLSLLFLL